MATHGPFSKFNPQREDWTSYTERLQEYFIANGIEESAKKKPGRPIKYCWTRNISAYEELDYSGKAD